MFEEKVTKRQIIILMIISRLSVTISAMPTIDIPPYNQDTWISILLSPFYSAVFMIPILFLANKFNEYNLIGYMEILYGKIFGKIIGVIYIAFTFYNCILAAFNHIELVGSTTLVGAMNSVLIFVLVVTTIYTVSRGLIVRSRAVEIFGPISIFIVLFLVALGIKDADFSFLLPVLSDSTPRDLNIGAIQLSLFYVDTLFLIMIVPDLENKKDINSIFATSLISSTIILILVVIICQATMGIEQIRHTNFPFHLYVRLIRYQYIIERIDVVFVLAWLITSQARVNSFIYITVRGFREIFNKGLREKYIVFIMSILLAISLLILMNRFSLNLIRGQLNTSHNIIYAIFMIAIPSLTCIVYFFRRKNINQKLIKNKGE